MAGQVLETLFVDIVQRGVKEAAAAVRGLTSDNERATASSRKLRDAVMDAGKAGRGSAGRQTTSMANSPTMRPAAGGGGLPQLAVAAVQAAQALRQLRGAATGTRVAEPVFQARRVADPVPKARLVREGNGNAKRKAEDGGAMGAIKQAGIALAGVTAAAAPFIAMIRQGLQGTVELDRFSQAVSLVSREVATLLGPPLRLAADVIMRAVSVFQQMGPAAQQLLGVFTGFGLIGQVIDDPALRGAMKELGASFTQLILASKPLVNQLAYFASALIKVGIVTPLVMFAQVLTVAARGLKLFVESAERGMRRFGLGFTMKDRGKRDELSLNQTGTEDAQGTFARIQEAVLKFGMDKEEDPQIGLLNNIEGVLKEIRGYLEGISKVKDMNPSASAAGGMNAVGVGAGAVGLIGKLFGK